MSARRRPGFRLAPALMRPGVRQIGARVLSPDLPWAVQRKRLDQVMRTALLPRGTAVTPVTLNGVAAERVQAPGADGHVTVVHFHGGGYCTGSPSMMRDWAARLSARAGAAVVVPDYRLAPEHPHPAALEDARQVLEAVAGETAPGAVVLSGDSAGGGLALALLLGLRDEGSELPAGCILLSPWLDLAADRGADPDLVRRDMLLSPRWLAACARAYAGPDGLADPAVSPLRAAHGGLPPLLIQAGTEELLAPDAAALAASASAAGTRVTYSRWPGLWHDFALQPALLGAARSALDQAAWFTKTVTGG